MTARTHRGTAAAAIAAAAIFVAAVAAASALTACRRAGPEQPAPVVDETPSTVAYAGCAGARRGPVCVLDEGDATLTLWVAGDPRDKGRAATFAIDGREASATSSAAVDGGTRIELAVPAGSRQLEVLHPAHRAPWRLALETAEPAAASGEAEQGRMLAERGKRALRRGEHAEARALLERSLSMLRRSGDLQAVVDAATVLVFGLITRDHDFAAARRLLDALPRGWQAPGESRYLETYYRGLLATVTGDARGALLHLEDAAAIARRTGPAGYRRAAEEMAALQLQLIGRRAEAAVLLEELIAEAEREIEGGGGGRCRYAGLLNNLAWNAWLASQAGEQGADPEPLLRRALEILERRCGEQLPVRQNALTTLALVTLQAGRADDARQALARAAALDVAPSLRTRLWWREVDGRLALADRRPDTAIEIYGELRALAEAALVPETVWRAELGLARARRAAGDRDGAVDAYKRAETRLDAALLRVPLQAGRETFLAQRQGATAEQLALLLELGRDDEALAVARRARIRLLRGLHRAIRLQGLDAEARLRWETFVADYRRERAAIDRLAAEDWTLAAAPLTTVHARRAEARAALARSLDAALAVLEPAALDSGMLEPLRLGNGEVALVVHPLPDGWAVFARRRGGGRTLRAADCPEAPRATLASCLLAPLRDWIEDASALRILAAGTLAEADWPAVEVAGRPLLLHAPLAHGLDLGPLRAGKPPRTAGSGMASALIVADPGGDLPRARDEAAAVRRHLGTGFAAEELLGRAASAAALARMLPAAELFHYAGHATFAGRGGWRTFLPLADGGRLTLEDVLVLARAPRWVVLSGCETARAGGGPISHNGSHSAEHSGMEPGGVAASLGLAQAFLAAGSETVIAAVRPVGDRAAAELAASFYPAWLAGAPPAAALRRAQLEIRRRRPQADWSSFRLIVR